MSNDARQNDKSSVCTQNTYWPTFLQIPSTDSTYNHNKYENLFVVQRISTTQVNKLVIIMYFTMVFHNNVMPS